VLYTGKSFVAGGTVFVAMNYRLGALGFAYSGDASKHSDDLIGNYGLMDQRLVLEWVRDNIAAFGGDPDAVTLFGESAGGMSVGTHLVTPSSTALFHRGMIESEPFALPFRTTSTYPAYTREFAHKAGCGDGVVNLKRYEPCLRNVSTAKLLAAQTAVRTVPLAMALSVTDLFIPFSPVVDRSGAASRGGAAAAAAADGTFTISDQVLRLWQQQGKGAGAAAALPAVMGTNADEGTIFVYGVFGTPLTSMLEADAILTLVFGVSNLGKIKKQYPLPKTGDLRPHLSVVVTDSLFRCPTRAAALTRRGGAGAAAANAAYQYHFDQIWSFSDALWNATDRACVCSSATTLVAPPPKRGLFAVRCCDLRSLLRRRLTPTPTYAHAFPVLAAECDSKCCHADELLGVFAPDLSIISSAYTATEAKMSAAIQVSVLLFTVTFYANHAHNLTRSP
jgi:carboxylesterase type B